MWMAVRRCVVVAIGFILQIALTVIVLLKFGEYFGFIQVCYAILSIILVLGIIKNSKSLSRDLPWILIIMLFPIVGSLLFVVLGGDLFRSKLLKNVNKEIEFGKVYLSQDKKIEKEIEDKNLDKLEYISKYARFPVSKNNELKYYSLGEQAYGDMLEELKNAKEFIFIEYFIIDYGIMWQSILDILKEKVKQGVDVRVMYDDMGSISRLPKKYPAELESYGIKCILFNELKPFIGVIMNHRDHRKIMVIDGKVAFSGGINLADEYINVKQTHGHWKDNAIRVKGDAVWNFTVMFLELWNAYRKEDEDYTKYKYDFKDMYKENGYVVPYGESPLDDEPVGANIYLNIINQAKKYVYIFTPYLVVDTEMINALTLAAKRGVDVRIVVPGIPDKKIVYSLTVSYFEQLIKYGVKIYTYTPGFVHSKVFVSDDNVATVGTINMDYRSLYLHFECGVFMQDTDIIGDVKKDIEETITKSHEVTKKEATPNLLKGLWRAILRLIAPLM